MLLIYMVPISIYRVLFFALINLFHCLLKSRIVSLLLCSKIVDLLGPETAVGNSSRESLSPSQQQGRKVVPLKKRRGNNSEEDNNKATASDNAEGKEKRCVGEIKKSEGNLGSMASKGRKKARGGVLAEGSRCSRVNGRGWRCFQQTLVGYSLCEHHLGKGRLRSMSASSKNKNGKNKAMIRQSNSTNSTKTTTTTMMTNSEEEEEEESGENEKAKKKKVKLGMVKARSISSLLGQTYGTEIVAPTDHYGDGDK